MDLRRKVYRAQFVIHIIIEILLDSSFVTCKTIIKEHGDKYILEIELNGWLEAIHQFFPI